MIRITNDLRQFLTEKHSDILIPLAFGHDDLFTENINMEFEDWKQSKARNKKYAMESESN